MAANTGSTSLSTSTSAPSASNDAMGSTNVIKATKAAIKECPREIFNFYLLACACIWSFSGVAKGFDEGVYYPNHE